ncbi:MAG: hypothetical protein KDK39_02140 [Leptospiraceae bacterium]|nr:hypothetical protein [Leptospiraceae bacterium]
MQVDDYKKLQRKTFLHNGIFVHQGSKVRILEINESDITVEFTDMEGFQHRLEGVQADELE